LEYLVKVETGEIDWSSINGSWVISRELVGKKVLIAVRRGNIFKNYGRAGTMDSIDADFDVELEAVEVGNKTICLDVLSVYNVSVQQMPLSQRLSSITQHMASVLCIECQDYYSYNDELVKKINDERVVNYVIQNSLDGYRSQRKRFSRILIDDKILQEEDYLVEREIEVKSTYEMQDVIEIKEVFQKGVMGIDNPEIEVPDLIITEYRKKGLFGEVKPQIRKYIIPKEEYVQHKQKIDRNFEENKKKNDKFKIFKRLKDLNLDPVLGFSNYDVANRVLQKKHNICYMNNAYDIDIISKYSKENLKRKREKN